MLRSKIANMSRHWSISLDSNLTSTRATPDALPTKSSAVDNPMPASGGVISYLVMR